MNRALAVPVTGAQVRASVIAAQQSLSLANIDPRYYVGTCFHEAGTSAEWDTEIATPSSPTGFISVGAYQIGDEEARRFGYQLEDMLDLDKATMCMVRLAEANRAAMRFEMKLADDVQDPDYQDSHGVIWAAGSMRAYLCLYHNHGGGFARTTIARYGMDWAKYKNRNPADLVVAHSYGDDGVTGGPNYPRDSVALPPP